MALEVRRGSGGVVPAINVTPLVDVILVLLIIFMVLTPQILTELAVTAPPVSPGQRSEETTTPLTITYTHDRKLFVDEELVLTLEGGAPTRAAGRRLTARVRQALAGRGGGAVFFRIDDGANYGEAVWVMDLCRGAGARTLGIAPEG